LAPVYDIIKEKNGGKNYCDLFRKGDIAVMKNEKNIGLMIGFVLALVTIGISLLFSKSRALDFFTIFLTGIVAAYAGFAFSGGRKQDILIEIPHLVLYLVLIFFSIWGMPYLLVVGYFWHGIWDLIHHPKISIVKTNVPKWYIYGCALYDWVIAVFILVWLI
jgi:hypothetical protein